MPFFDNILDMENTSNFLKNIGVIELSDFAKFTQTLGLNLADVQTRMSDPIISQTIQVLYNSYTQLKNKQSKINELTKDNEESKKKDATIAKLQKEIKKNDDKKKTVQQLLSKPLNFVLSLADSISIFLTRIIDDTIKAHPTEEEFLKTYKEQIASELKDIKEIISKLVNENLLQEEQVSWLTTLVGNYKKEIYGVSSEINENLIPINELEIYADNKEILDNLQNTLDSIKFDSFKEKKASRKDLNNSPEFYELENRETYAASKPEKGSQYTHFVGYEERRQLKILKGLYTAVIKKYAIYEDDYGNRKYFCSKKEGEVLESRMLTEETIATIIYDRFVNNMPFYRQEASFKRDGINLSRMTMCYELQYVYYFCLKPIIDSFKEIIRGSTYVRSDETPMKIISESKESNKHSKTNSYMWLFSNISKDKPVFYYQCGPGRGKDVPCEFFKDSGHKYIQCDGWNAYKNIPNAEPIYCGQHIDRKWLNIEENYVTLATPFTQLWSRLCRLEEYNQSKNWPDADKILQYRIENELPVVNLMKEYVDSLTNIIDQSNLAHAIHYTKEHWDGFMKAFKDGHLELTNNASERGIRPFVMGRKSSLFFENIKGCEVSCGYYSLVETSKANNIDIIPYIVYLLLNLPKLKDGEIKREGFNYDKYMPWSNSIKNKFTSKAEKN